MQTTPSITMRQVNDDGDLSMVITVPKTLIWRLRGSVAARLIVWGFALLGGRPTLG